MAARKQIELTVIISSMLRKNNKQRPGEDSNPVREFLRNQSLNTVGLFELPRKLPTLMARWDGTGWHLLGSDEPACHLGGRQTQRLALATAELIAEVQADGSRTTDRYGFVPLRVVSIQFSPRVGQVLCVDLHEPRVLSHTERRIICCERR